MNISKLCPAFKDYLWGGERLAEAFGKETDVRPLAESWELSFHRDGLTRLPDGRTLAEAVSEAELGENVTDFEFFPLLVKFIDAKQSLSVQVHPSDEYALAHENSYGKTEMWYIVDADEDAGIYLGFDGDITGEEFEAAIAANTLKEKLKYVKVRAGECYFIPSGTVHAIGEGCLICEIQQNSNLTYSVYDWGRKDKNGHSRELHVEKAMAVSRLGESEIHSLDGDMLGVSRYFSARLLEVAGTVTLTPYRSFQCLICVAGSGEINGQTVRAGDSFFVPANYGEYEISGNMKMILTEVRKLYVGIDLGGTFIKGGIVDDTGRIIISDKIPTEREKGDAGVAANIARLCDMLLKRANMTAGDIVGIGIGVPGMIDSAAGEVVYSNNLGWSHFKISETVESLVGAPVRIANDANVAALGETKFGCGKDFSTTVMITLGTGVGSGIVIGGKLFEGNHSAGAELGHMVIVSGGEKCTCGRRGCLEAYASATALIRDTKRAMENNSESKMWQIGTLDEVTGKTAFDYMENDADAKAVVENYIEKLSVGLVNIANIFRPEAIILGGGVCAEGDRLTIPLGNAISTNIFGGEMGPRVKLLVARLGNSAGLLGAAALWM